jgi:hypothetical protein
MTVLFFYLRAEFFCCLTPGKEHAGRGSYVKRRRCDLRKSGRSPFLFEAEEKRVAEENSGPRNKKFQQVGGERSGTG